MAVVVHTVVQPAVAARTSVAIDRTLLAQARERRVPVLRVHAWPGDVLLLGRYHRSPAPSAETHRRFSGGRAFPAGAGFVRVSVILPHRSAFESDDPHALRAEQVLNRAVRGVMAGLERLGLEPYYPGRDLVTVGGKPIAWLSLAVEDDGATLVEIGLSVERDLSSLAPLADRIDPTGIVPITFWNPDDVTSVARGRGGRTPSFAEVVTAIVTGYRQRLGWETVPDDALGQASASDGDVRFDLPADLTRCGRRAVMLGTLLAFVRLEPDGTIGTVRLAGDLIAPTATVRAVERALAGQPAAHAAVLARVESVLASSEHFVLGASAADVATTVLAGATP